MTFEKTKQTALLRCTTHHPDLVVTIDGPAGAGKTTVSKIIAERLGYRYIDTGALYRGVAYEAHKSRIAADDDPELEHLCRSLALDVKPTSAGMRLYSNGEDISDYLRTPEISMLASAISAREPVRRFLLDIQRDFGKNKRVVLEGRDTGTVVFPEADVKFFLMASEEARALRRFRQTAAENHQSLDQVKQEMRKRDTDDSTRALAPLMPADDAILIDSSGLNLEEVIEIMLTHIRAVSDSPSPAQRV